MPVIYLDHQASTGLGPGVLEAMQGWIGDNFANPHATEHSAGWAAAEAIERARASIASAIGCEDDEVYFTSGASESNAIAILGAVESALERGVARRRIVVSAIEHKSVIGAARTAARRGFVVDVAPVEVDGTVNMARLQELIDDRTLLVSIGAANNEVGTLQDLALIGQLCASSGAIFHVDAAQALAFGGFNAGLSGAHFASASAHKCGGPKGVGVLFVARGSRGRIDALSFGGGQEDGLRSGTLPTPLCVGFGRACEVIPASHEVARWRERTERFRQSLLEAFPGAMVNGHLEKRHPGNVSLRLPGVAADVLIARCQPGLAISTGSACTSGIPEPSHVLSAIGLDGIAAGECLRLSTSVLTTDEELDAAIKALDRAARGMAAELLHPGSQN